jgi:hypothetical protein
VTGGTILFTLLLPCSVMVERCPPTTVTPAAPKSNATLRLHRHRLLKFKHRCTASDICTTVAAATTCALHRRHSARIRMVAHTASPSVRISTNVSRCRHARRCRDGLVRIRSDLVLRRARTAQSTLMVTRMGIIRMHSRPSGDLTATTKCVQLRRLRDACRTSDPLPLPTWVHPRPRPLQGLPDHPPGSRAPRAAKSLRAISAGLARRSAIACTRRARLVLDVRCRARM